MSIDDGTNSSSEPTSFNWGLGGSTEQSVTPSPIFGDEAIAASPITAPPTGPVDYPATDTLTAPLGSLRPRQRARTTGLGWAALVFAFLVPPLGFVLSLVARAFSLRRFRRTTSVISLALTLSIVFTLLAGAGGVVALVFAQAAEKEKQITADSQPFCTSLATTPGVLDQPAYGWPTDVKPLADSLVDMNAYATRWKALAAIAPDGIHKVVKSVVDAATTIINNVTVSQTIDRDANLASMVSVTSATTSIPEWVAKYCTN
jgi:hypothetical protein